MQGSAAQFEQRLVSLRGDLAEQGRRVQRVIEAAIDAVFDKFPDKARFVIDEDSEIDRVDVAIEKESVRLLADALREHAALGEYEVRLVLTIVKVNNELERIADAAVAIAERVQAFVQLSQPAPARFRMMANSVIGIMHTTNSAVDALDTDAARLVLASDDATEAFKQAVLHEVEERLARGEHTVDYAFALHAVASSLEQIAAHCTNIAEQVIYVESGKIVRHLKDHWSEPEQPD